MAVQGSLLRIHKQHKRSARSKEVVEEDQAAREEEEEKVAEAVLADSDKGYLDHLVAQQLLQSDCTSASL